MEVAPYVAEIQTAQSSRSNWWPLAAVVGGLAFGAQADRLAEPPAGSLNIARLEAVQSLAAAGTPQKVFDAIVQSTAEESTTAAGTPWPVIGGAPTLHNVLINYTNVPDGYSLGNLTEDDTARLSGVTKTITVIRHGHPVKQNWSLIQTYHQVRPTDLDCGWARTIQLRRVNQAKMPGVCRSQVEQLKHRDSFGVVYNKPPHVGIDGTYDTRRKPDCEWVPLNHNFDQHVGHVPYQPAPPLPFTDGGIHYRSTTPDHVAATARAKLKVANSTTSGYHHYKMWGFDHKDCDIGPFKGGPSKPGL